MTAPKKIARGAIPSVDDFKLTPQQRDFHDRYTASGSPSRLNAYQSALAAGYTETSAKTVSSKWVPSSGHTPDSIRSCKFVVQAIFWTLHREKTLRDEVNARTMERTIERQVERTMITKEFIESNLLELAMRCMGKDVKAENLKIAARCIDEAALPDKLDAALRDRLIESFMRTCNQHKVFHPAGAKEALKLLGIEIGMFMKILRAPPETPVDAMSVDQLAAEKQRLEKQYAEITAVTAKKSNGGHRAKSN